MLIDTNGDDVPDSREFAGAHRYITAVKLAERFARDEGSISTVIIASGESQVDAVAAAGLAGNLNAPVLLTRSSMLPHNVARFIDEQNVTDVMVVGGPAAVSDAVVTQLEALGSRPTVDRVTPDGITDRYDTAAAIGSRLGGPNPTWCGSTQTAAILVNGGDAGRADAVVAGPLAFRLGLPVLLTMADELPEATAAFLTENKVERVVIVGGTGAVSAEVEDALVEDVGVVNTQRIDGGSAAATSVMVAKEMLGNCADVLQTNDGMFALVNRDAIADGIAAAPVLGRGLGAAGSVPILLVGDELPAAVSDYLSSTLNVNPATGNKTHVSIVAIGGTAVVSNSVMDDAKAAAKTSDMLTATITPITYTATTLGAARATGSTHPCAASVPASAGAGSYTCQFRVTFSDDVKLAEDADETADGIQADERVGTVEDPTMYRLNGRRIAASSATAASQEPVSLLDLVFTADRTVTLTLTHHLEAGDTITVDNSANEADGSRLGDNEDKRTLERAELMLPAVTIAVDRTAPVVEVIAIPNFPSNMFDVLVTEPNLLHQEIVNAAGTAAASNLTDFVSIQPHGRDAARKATGIDATAATTTSPLDADRKPRGRATIHHRYRITTDVALEHGDVIVIERKAILDRGGRGSPLIRYTVPRDKTNTLPPTDPTGNGDLEVQSVSIGNVVHGNADGSGHAFATILTSKLRVSAKATGIAAGAQGNAWRIFGYDDREDGASSTNAFTITTAVDIANQRISYTIDDALPIRPHRTAQIGDLAAALASNSDFAANFSLGYVTSGTPPVRVTGSEAKDDPLEATDPAGAAFGSGISKVGVVVRFNAAIATLTGTTANTNGGDDLAWDIAPRFPGAPGVTDTTVDGADAMVVSLLAPDNQVHISYTSDSMAELPTRSGFRVIAADVAHGYDGSGTARSGANNGNVREILNSLRPDSSISP